MAHDTDALAPRTSTMLTTTLANEVRRCAVLADDIGAAAAHKALKVLDPNAAALVAAEVFGDNTEWL